MNNVAYAQVDFTFRNYSELGSSITEVYFDDGTLLGIDLPFFTSGSGVSFYADGQSVGSKTNDVNPGNIPAANGVTPAFAVTRSFDSALDDFSADVVKNTADGVQNLLDAGTQEYLTIRMTLLQGKTFLDTIAALNGVDGGGTHSTSDGLLYPALRVGLHVRAFDVSGEDVSESFMNTSTFYPENDPFYPQGTPMPVPEPESLALLLAGFGVVGFIARRRKL